MDQQKDWGRRTTTDKLYEHIEYRLLHQRGCRKDESYELRGDGDGRRTRPIYSPSSLLALVTPGLINTHPNFATSSYCLPK